MRKVYLWGIFVLLFIPFSSFAQYNFQQIDNSSGLSNSCINSVYQDSEHLIWFGTWDGLDYYDGTNIHVFNYERETRKNSIASNVIYQVTGDRQRNIWIGTVEGLSRFDKNTGDFSNYFYNREKVVSNGYTVAVDSRGDVYAGRRNSADLFQYDNRTDRFSRAAIMGLKDYMLLRMLFDGNDNFWLLKDDGILEAFRRQGGMFIKQPQFKSVDNVDNIFFCNGVLFYCTKDGGLYRVGPGMTGSKVLALPHEVRSVAFYNGHYVIARASKGIGEYDVNFKPEESLSNNLPLLQHVRITSLLTTGNNILWLGTDGNGVIKVVKKETWFGVIQKQPNGQSFNIPVRAFSYVNGELWIGTKGNGIVTIKNFGKENAAFSTIRSFHTNVDLLDNCVYAIQKAHDGLVYIGSDAPGITLYDERTRRFIRWGDIRDSRKYGAFGSAHCILFENDGSVWLGLNEGGLVHLKIARKGGSLAIKYLQHYVYDGTEKGPGNNVIYSLARGGDSRLWIGCRYGGLSLFDARTGKFKTIKAQGYSGSLSNNDVLSLFVDHRRRLWVGTSFGLNYTDEAAAGNGKPLFKKFFVDDGLPNNTVHAIEEDGQGNIWLSTNKGLARVNPQKGKIVRFKESDGLQSDEFSDNAAWKDPSGMLFFGGIYGFNYFLPQRIAINNDQPHLLISGLQFAGNNETERGLKVLTSDGSGSGRHYTLAPQDNYFELSLEPISYTHPQKCQYAYYLEGSDKAWHFMGSHEKIIYNNITPGNYSLKIRWSNGEGVWTPGITTFTLTVEQYPWLKPIAFVCYGFVLLISGGLYLPYRRNKFIMRHELKLETMLREKDEKLHQQQLNFFTNIAHELQTPLTLILGSLERYIYKTKNAGGRQDNYFLSVVKQEASRLHYLVLQLLEFRKAEEGYLKNHLSYIDISGLLSNIAGVFEPLSEPKKLAFSAHIDPGISAWLDKDKIEKIVFNLLSNAFKHTTGGQSVIVSAITGKEPGTLEISVVNSGCTLKADELAHLFERFFVAGNSRQEKISSGIGLAFTRQLVSLLGGDIAVSCQNGWIAFKVRLPLNLVPDKNESGGDAGEKNEKPSYLFRNIAETHYSAGHVSPTENNKKALMQSFAQEDKKIILIVEDEQRIRYLLKDILKEQYIIYEAENGDEALAVVRRVKPDLIVSDIVMSDMDGLKLCHIIKTTDETCHIPFVILSARGTTEQQTEGYSSGADAYIPKPFQTEHLLVRISKLLEYRDRLHRYFDEHRVTGRIRDEDIKDSDKFFIEKIIKVIDDNMDEDLDNAFLENALNLSRIQLYRKVKTLSNMTPAELIRYTRLQKASSLLLNSDLTVSEIFYRTGFNNKTYFFREFKKVYKLSPNDYRHHHRLPLVRNN